MVKLRIGKMRGLSCLTVWANPEHLWHFYVVPFGLWRIINERILYTRVIGIGPVVVSLTDLSREPVPLPAWWGR